MEYGCDSFGDSNSWMMIRARRFESGALPRIVVSHTDITAFHAE